MKMASFFASGAGANRRNIHDGLHHLKLFARNPLFSRGESKKLRSTKGAAEMGSCTANPPPQGGGRIRRCIFNKLIMDAGLPISFWTVSAYNSI